MCVRISPAVLMIGLAALFAGCVDRSVSHESSPEVQRAAFEQLSAGGGIAGFDFYIGFRRVGALLVTNGLEFTEGGYYDEKEYWRWDQSALDDLAAGDVTSFSVGFVGTADKWDSRIVDRFESGTNRWTAWVVNRLFDVNGEPQVVWNDPDGGRPLYHMRTDLWGDLTGSIDYYLRMDFSGGAPYPEMTWYIDHRNFLDWLAAEKSDDDDDGIYEVRLEEATSFRQTSVAVGHELKTLK